MKLSCMDMSVEHSDKNLQINSFIYMYVYIQLPVQKKKASSTIKVLHFQICISLLATVIVVVSCLMIASLEA